MAPAAFIAAFLLATLSATVDAAPTRALDAFPARVTPNFLDHEGAYLKLERRQSSNVTMPVLNKQGCLPAGTTAQQMNLILAQNAQGAKVILCPNTNYPIANTLIFQSNYQEVMTLGYPTGSTRATLTVVGPNMSVAIYGACDQCVGISVRSVQINGNRPALGTVSQGAAIIEIGGNPPDQVVRDSYVYEPRGWSCIHIIEGYMNNCRNATILNNQVGPSGNSPNTAQQFKRAVAYQAPGYWADGISNACGASLIKGNTIIDATDGAIVQFGAPNTTITQNTIISRTRVALGGINMVDMGAWGGDFTGVSIDNNVIRTEGAMIKIGIPLGPFTWSPVNNTDYRTRNGQVSNNKFVSIGAGYFGYAIAAAGHNNTNVRGNDVSAARFGGIPSGWCVGDVPPPKPVAPGIVYDPYTTYGSMQTSAVQKTLAFLICIMQSAYGTYTYPADSSAASSTAAPSSTATGTVVKAGKAGATSTTTIKKVGKMAAMLIDDGATATDDSATATATAIVKQGKVLGRDIHSALMVARRPSTDAGHEAEELLDGWFEQGPASPWAKRDVLEPFVAGSNAMMQ